MLRRTALLVIAAVAAAAVPHATAATAPPIKVPVVTLVDTGARATHAAFDYRGKASTTDQFVGWWDFSAEKKHRDVWPARGQVWDTAVRDPYDSVGHGTLTASMVGGRRSSAQTPSAYPGAKLAIAKVSYDAAS